MGKLDGKVALITGAGSGMGRATAILFAKEGARVAVSDYAPAGGKETVKTIQEGGGHAIFIEADVSKAADVERMVKTTVDTYGRLDILYSNAGVPQPMAPLADITEEEWDRVVGINMKGVFLGSKYAIPVMLNQGGGVIINTASIGGLVGSPYEGIYCASKGGVVLLTKSMAIEYGKKNIRANCICPGLIRTGMSEGLIDYPAALEVWMRRQPLVRLGQAEDVARAALYLACDDSLFVTGTCLVVDGGVTATSGAANLFDLGFAQNTP
jgi:NAD(P)-dependent dehydrogenase (short-subunit alcohol dehydrogenase family)